MAKIGLYGGTFNPPHLGHLALAKTAKNKFSLDKIIWIPTGNSYLKQNVLPCEERFAMTKLLIEGEKDMEISDIEIKREGASYSYITVEAFKSLFPSDDLYFLLGADSLLYMDHWRNPDIIFKNATILCAYRNDGKEQEAAVLELQNKKEELERSFGASIDLMEFDEKISSSQIRTMVHEGEPIDSYVPATVKQYIFEKGFYHS